MTISRETLLLLFALLCTLYIVWIDLRPLFFRLWHRSKYEVARLSLQRWSADTQPMVLRGDARDKIERVDQLDDGSILVQFASRVHAKTLTARLANSLTNNIELVDTTERRTRLKMAGVKEIESLKQNQGVTVVFESFYG